MKKFKYLKISKTKKLRYLDNNFKKNLYIVFLHGFMSDIEGEKPKVFKKYANKNKLGFFAVECSGHGKSSGKFINGNISIWSNDVKVSIKKIVKKNNFILIGSSMGAWLSLNILKHFERQIKAFIGIGPAPEFIKRIMWKKFDNKTKKEIIKKGISYVKSGEHLYPITRQLVKDGRKNNVLSKKIKLPIFTTMIHGEKDDVVPISFSRKILSMFTGAKKSLVIIKNGDHSLSKKNHLKLIKKELDKVVFNKI
jgi:uncharacterized protein